MPALRIYGRRWHTCTDMVPVPSILGLLFHGAWIVVFSALVRIFHEWETCRGPGVHYIVTTAGLWAVFVVSFAMEVVLTVIGCRGTPLEISKRYAVVPILYVQSVVWILQAIFMLYGTVVVAVAQPSCWQGMRQRHVLMTTQAMVYSTWIFSVVLWLTVYVVYNAYPARAKVHTWEKRVVCISWVFGCYKTMMQQVDGRSAPLTSVAQMLSGLFGNADLTPSDLVAALVLCTAAQHQRRRLHIKHALEPVEDVLSNLNLSESNGSDEQGGVRDDGAQMYTGIDERTLAKQTSENGSAAAPSLVTTPGRTCDSPRDSGDANGRVGTCPELHSTPSSALRHSLESKRRSSVDHVGHMQGIAEASSSQEAVSRQSNGVEPDQANGGRRASGSVAARPDAPDQATAPAAGAPATPEQETGSRATAPDQATEASAGGSEPEQAQQPEEAGRDGNNSRGTASVISLLETGRAAVTSAAAAVFGKDSAANEQPSPRMNGLHTGAGEAEERGKGTSMTGDVGSMDVAGSDVASDVSQDGSGGEKAEGEESEGIGGKLKQLKERFSIRGSETGEEEEEAEKEREKLQLPEELKEKLKEKVRRQSEKWREAGPAVGEVAGHKVSAPDKDTTILRLPHRHESKGSSDIGPIWTERDSAGRGAKQAGGADRVSEEGGSEDGSSEKAAPGPLSAFGNYVGSWLGMASVPEGTEQDPDEDLMAVPDVPGQSPNQSHHGAGSGNGAVKSSAGRSGSITLNLSEVDAQTLRDYERRTGSTAEGMEHIIQDFHKTQEFPSSRRISQQFPVILTPSEQVSEQVEELNIDMEPGEIVDDILGKRKNVAYDTLVEAADYARFACAAYAVVEYQDTREGKPKAKVSGCCGCCTGCCCCASKTVESDEVRRTIADVAGVDEKDILYFSPSNQALAHLPYCIALDKKRKAVVVAIRGTMSMADVVTDAVVHPEGIDDWLPPKLSKRNKHKRGTAFGHAGIVASASAVLADLEKGGILRVLLGGDEERETMDEEGGADNKGEAVGAIMQEKVDAKGYRLVVTGHSLGAGAAALISLKLRDRFEDLKCWAFSPPGGLISESLLPAMSEWCVSVVCGKDAVPRMTVNNLSRLMDEMVTALARARHHKLRVLIGGWWRKEKRPPPHHLFRPYEEIPLECRIFLEKYYKSVERRGKEMDMYPPGRIIFVRPLKTLVGRRHRGGPRRLQKGWDCVWITPKELIAEGILISGRMMEHHLLQSTVQGAIDHVLERHPGNPNPKKAPKRRRLRKKSDNPKDFAELAQVVVEGPEQQSPL